MWRRVICSHIRTVTSSRPALTSRVANPLSSYPHLLSPSSAASASHFTRRFSADSVNTAAKKKVEDAMPIATGHEREELEAELEGKEILDINFPVGPFGTK